ncbi:MAG TPA: DUF460 domain-containing protein [Candidatus Aenigmarchaeota archaeon]|nr:DUF460 domain-containing protein [Candidatus Aenigmarchaeota archaeon]
MLLIAGVDFGTNTSLALINLEGKLIYLGSGKDLKIIKICLEKGRVIAVTTDKRESKKARKLAATLEAELILPRKDLSRFKKLKLLKDYRTLKLNSHEKSSLASAIFAHKFYKQKLKRFEDEIGPANLDLKEEFILSNKRIAYFKTKLLKKF